MNAKKKFKTNKSKQDAVWLSEWFGDALLILWSVPFLVIEERLFTHVVIGEKVWNRAVLMLVYIYIMAVLRSLTDRYWTKKNILWLGIIGLAPTAAVQSVKWYSRGSKFVIFAMVVMVFYLVILLWQMIGGSGNRAARIRRWRSGMSRIMGCFCVLALAAGTVGKIETAERGNSLEQTVSEDRGFLDADREYLRMWRAETYDRLTDPEKMELFQKLADLECQYFGIEPITVEKERYERESQRGYYSEYGRILSISETLFRADRAEVLETLFHECHHAYAHALVNHVAIVESMIKTELRMYRDVYVLREGFANYVEAEEDYNAYYTNPVEVEARAYARERRNIFLGLVETL